MPARPKPYDTIDEELEAVTEDAGRLVVALNVVLSCLRKDDDMLHLIIGPPNCQLTVGHVVKGALALHEQVEARRPR